MKPRPPDLSHSAREMSDAEVSRVIENGIRHTGMPPFGPSHSGHELAALTAFVERLGDLSPEDYRRLADGASADGHAHGGEGLQPTGDVQGAATEHGHEVARSGRNLREPALRRHAGPRGSAPVGVRTPASRGAGVPGAVFRSPLSIRESAGRRGAARTSPARGFPEVLSPGADDAQQRRLREALMFRSRPPAGSHAASRAAPAEAGSHDRQALLALAGPHRHALAAWTVEQDALGVVAAQVPAAAHRLGRRDQQILE